MEDNKHNNSNPFDDIGLDLDPETIKKHQSEQQSRNERLDFLIHKTFAQTQSGIDLMVLWDESLRMAPGLQPGMCDKEAGIIEGKKSFIRSIILTIRRIEQND